MASAAIADIFRTGRDPNNAYWIIARYRRDFKTAVFTQTLFDVQRNVIELTPVSAMRNPAGWLPMAAVYDDAGNAYRADRKQHVLLYKPACETNFRPVECLGGYGWQTGEFHSPTGVTFDCRGWLLVADSGNHRVQVIKPEHRHVIAVLGETDQWGKCVCGISAGAMVEPVHAVCDPATYFIYVADRTAGLIHVFDDRFEYVKSFVPATLSSMFESTSPESSLTDSPRVESLMPIAVAIATDGSLLVLDAAYPRIMRMTTDGVALDDMGVDSLHNPFPAGRDLQPRYLREGEIVIGPLSNGVYDQSWHKLNVEADIPAGASIELQSYASNSDQVDIRSIPWAPVKPVAVTSETSTPPADENKQRLVLSDIERWKRFQHGGYERARPVLKEFNADGPSSSDSFILKLAVARRLRVADTIEISTDSSSEQLLIAQLTTTEFRCYASGTAMNYTAGAEIWLRARAGKTLTGGERLLHTLNAAEVIDASNFLSDNERIIVMAPHQVSAIVRPGDVIQLRHAGNVTQMEIEQLDLEQSVTITTNVAVAGDYSTSKLQLLNTPGRLVATELEGFEFQTPYAEALSVDDALGTHAAQIALVEFDVETLWLELGSTVDVAQWGQFFTEKDVATDRGQYLWIRLRLRGALNQVGDTTAVATPSIHSVRALTPRPSYLDLLPAVYARIDPDRDASGSLFLERYLALFEGQLTKTESLFEAISSLLNLESTNEEWLVFMSTWMGLVLNPLWNVERRRQLQLEVMDLYQKRGTREGLSRYLEIYTGNKPVILEGFQWRPASSMVVGKTGRLGCSSLKSQACDYEPYAHRFGIHVFVDEISELDVLESSIRSIIESIKPAHTDYDLILTLPETRVGCQSMVGIDMVLSDRPMSLMRLSNLDDAVVPENQAIVGKNRLTKNPSNSNRSGGPMLTPGGIESSGITLN